MNQESEGISTRSLLGAFFAVVLLCAVFFALGFFLGYRQGHAGNELATEQVPPSSDVPQAVNPPPSSSPPPVESPAAQSQEPAAATTESDQSTEASGSTAPSGSSSRPTGAPAAKVSEETLSPPKAAAPKTAATRGSAAPAVAQHVPAGVLVQLAALSNQQDAVNMVNVLKSRGYPALILTPAQAKADDALFRVAVGPYKTRAEADKARTLLAAGGFKPFIRE